MNEVTEQKLDKYFKITGTALKELEIRGKAGLCINGEMVANDFRDMAQRYFDDAKHFKEKGDFVTAYGALNFAHGFLDAGARLGLFKTKTKGLIMQDEDNQ